MIRYRVWDRYASAMLEESFTTLAEADEWRRATGHLEPVYHSLAVIVPDPAPVQRPKGVA